LFILLSVTANAAKAASSKFASKSINSLRSNICFNGVRNALCCIIALGMALAFDFNGIKSLSWQEVQICTVSGVAMVLFTLSWTFAVRGEAYMLVSAFNSSNFIIPCVVGILFLGEKVTVTKGISVLMIVCALYLMVGHNLKIKGRLTPKAFITLLVIMLSGGINNTMQKLYSVSIDEKNVAYYTFYTFFVAAVIMLFSVAFFKDNGESFGCINLYTSRHLAIMSVGMFLATYFQSFAAKTLDTIILYPTVNALSLIAGSIMSALLFKERITTRCIVGIILVFSALMLSKL
jgi:drug/metabolite transporter (DMT)-like permease